ncbi:MAG: ferrous iron transport protein B [Methanophagales archaeon]|nr:ferrous iron transport protein B [Methanophagales archaeon]
MSKVWDLGEDPEVILAERRYEAIGKILETAVRKEAEKKTTFTDMLDHVFLHKLLGIPIFLALLWAVFQFTFAFSEPFMVGIERSFGWLGGLAAAGLAANHPHLASFVADGIFGGLGSVLVFVPPIFLLFLALAVLEGSGYLARAAFVMDRIMYKLGLHGRSFIPMMCGFGCNIPAIMATRSIENEKDRMITILVNPLISCGARLPVYVLISGVVFGFGSGAAGTAVFSMYVLGIVLAIVMALVFRRTLFKGRPAPFVLELPRYAVPTAKSAVLHMWERGKWFLIRAGTVIFAVVIVIWFLSVHPWAATEGGEIIEASYVAALGHFIEPVFAPFGWDWRAGVAIIFGFLAKEVVVATYALLLGTGEEAVGDALVSAGVFTPLTGLAFMAFVLIYVPCVATIGAIWRETNSLKWTVFSMAYLTVLAFVVAGLILGVGRLLGFS